jgi:hypothetical protein
MAHILRLKVEKIAAEDTWKDIIRVKKDFRRDVNNKQIKRGAICRLSCGARSKWVIVHGRAAEGNILEIDLSTRLALKLDYGASYDFTLTRISWLTSLWFPWKASDPIFRVPAQLSLISLFLGIVAIVVGAVPIYKDYVKEHGHHSASACSVDSANKSNGAKH